MSRGSQLSEQDLAERAERVSSMPSVRRIGAEDLALASGTASQQVHRDLRLYQGLTDVKLRSSRESTWGIYVAESSKVVRRALDAGHLPQSFLMSEKWAEDLSDVLASHPQVPAYVASEAVLEELTGFHLHRGALAVMHRPAPVSLAEVLEGARRVAVLEDIVDHTNVGAIFRSAAALGVDAVVVTPRCADPLYRRAIRVSMGTVFQVPWARAQDWPGDLEVLHQHGFTTAALALTADSVGIDELAAEGHEKLALVLGTEGDGLGKEALARTRRTVLIPMHHQVDSLNVAAASAVAFWETRVTADRP